MLCRYVIMILIYMWYKWWSRWCRYDICNNDIDINVMLQRVTNYFGTLLPDVIPGLTIYNILTDCSPVQISSSSSSPSITQSLIFNMISVVQPCKSSRVLFFFLFAKFISELNNVELTSWKQMYFSALNDWQNKISKVWFYIST